MKNHAILLLFYLIIKIILYLDLKMRFFPEIIFFDVGQGDSIFITTPQGKKILIDGGPHFTVSHKLNSYFPLNNCKLDAVFLTHPHADHIEGLNRIIQNCIVDKVFYTPVLYESSLYKEWEDFFSKDYSMKDEIICKVNKTKNINFMPFVKGDVYFPDKSKDVAFIGLWPPKDFIGKDIPNVNNVSTALLFNYGNFETLLTGDAELEVFKNMKIDPFYKSIRNKFIDDRLEVYKVSHHGAKNGFDIYFWRNLNPLLNVISVGVNNKFGHPNKEVTSQLSKDNGKIFRTDIEGTIKIRYNSL